MNRILLFLGTNIAILVVLSITMRLLGIEGVLDEQGVNLDLNSLLVFSAVIGFGGSFISLAISKWSAKRMTGAQIITQPKNDVESWLFSTVKRYADQAGIKTPEVAIYDSPDINAFATGATRNSSMVAVSTGLLRSMAREEAEAVIGHEVSHVANGDMVTMTLIQGVVNTFVIFLSRVVGFIVDRVVFKTERGFGPGYFITSIVAQILLGILASMIVMAFSRHREFKADAGGAHLAGRASMIAALERLGGQTPAELQAQMNGLGVSGGVGQGLKRLFMSHPPLPERIAALKKGASA
ncbi:MAG: protease HtpX [Gammaproteobacteria bacterium]